MSIILVIISLIKCSDEAPKTVKMYTKHATSAFDYVLQI